MTTLHGIFRKLVLRNIPALTDEDLDKYDGLLALRLELIHRRDIIPGPVGRSLAPPKFNRLHDFYPLRVPRNGEEELALPGRVSLNVFGARRFTYIHEFAHAMCSVFHGEIVDEYTDGYVFANHQNQNGNQLAVVPWHSINRIQKDPALLHKGDMIGVHKEFATYNCTRFQSDLDHPSAEANWFSYYPERTPRGLTCAMDRGTGFNHFDQLISTFMYDRILAKLIRKKLPKKKTYYTFTEAKKANSGVKSHHLALGRIFKPIGVFFYELYINVGGWMRSSKPNDPGDRKKTNKEETQNTASGGGGNGKPSESTKEKLDDLIKNATEAAHQIIEPHRAEFKALHQLWMARRQLAFQQEDILQIPTTLERVWRLIIAFLNYKEEQIKTFIIIARERSKAFITQLTIAWDHIRDIFTFKTGSKKVREISFQKKT